MTEGRKILTATDSGHATVLVRYCGHKKKEPPPTTHAELDKQLEEYFKHPPGPAELSKYAPSKKWDLYEEVEKMVEDREKEAAKGLGADEKKRKAAECRLYDLAQIRHHISIWVDPYFMMENIKSMDTYDYEERGRGLWLPPSKTATQQPDSTQGEIIGQ